MSQYVNLRTGGIITTRRDFGKGLAAIISAGVAPSIALGLAGSANASVGRGMMRNVGARNAAMFGGGKPTAKDYVQDGLVSIFDGIENSGWGTHDPSLRFPTDLFGNVLNIPSYPFPVMGENNYALVNTANQISSEESNAIYEMIYTGHFSFEIVVDVLNYYQSDFPGIIGLGTISGNEPNKAGTMYFCNKRLFYNLTKITYSSVKYDGGIITSSTVQDTSSREVYFNSSFNSTKSSDINLVNDRRLHIGRLNAGSCNTRFYCIRMYCGKKLSPNDIAHNYAIDKARFNLT